MVGEFDGVADEVVEHLIEALRIADDGRGHVGIDAVGEFQTLLGGLGRHGVDHGLDNSAQIEFLGHARHFGLGLGGGGGSGTVGMLEHASEKSYDGFGGAVKRFNVVTLRAAQRCFFQLLDTLDQVGERILQHFGEADDQVW